MIKELPNRDYLRLLIMKQKIQQRNQKTKLLSLYNVKCFSVLETLRTGIIQEIFSFCVCVGLL